MGFVKFFDAQSILAQYSSVYVFYDAVYHCADGYFVLTVLVKGKDNKTIHRLPLGRSLFGQPVIDKFYDFNALLDVVRDLNSSCFSYDRSFFHLNLNVSVYSS